MIAKFKTSLKFESIKFVIILTVNIALKNDITAFTTNINKKPIYK